jgi:hypothetical protein
MNTSEHFRARERERKYGSILQFQIFATAFAHLAIDPYSLSHDPIDGAGKRKR